MLWVGCGLVRIRITHWALEPLVSGTAIADGPLPNRCVSGDPPIGNYQFILLDEAHLDNSFSFFSISNKSNFMTKLTDLCCGLQ